jgi:hypothetical protein
MDLKVKTSSFSGKSKDWSKWSKTFLAKASLRSYKSLLIGALNHPEQELELETSEETLSELQRIFLLMNGLAYADLLISCQEDISFSIMKMLRVKRCHVEMPEWRGLSWKTSSSHLRKVLLSR